jgi:hypothetical protein
VHHYSVKDDSEFPLSSLPAVLSEIFDITNLHFDAKEGLENNIWEDLTNFVHQNLNPDHDQPLTDDEFDSEPTIGLDGLIG